MKSSVFWDITLYSSLKVLEEHVTSIFGVEEEGKHETIVKQVAGRAIV
jgi:hypothetical protein